MASNPVHHVFYSLKGRLLLLVFIAVVPALLLILYFAYEQYNKEKAEIEIETLHLTEQVSGDSAHVVEGARQVLTVISQLQSVVNNDSTACKAKFANFKKQFPMYCNILATKPNGDVFCSAVPLKGQLNLAERLYFKNAVKNRGFFFGGYQMGRLTGKPCINAGMPIIDPNGQLRGVIALAIDLEWLNKQIATTQLPRNAAITMFDRNGTVLARYPNPEKWIGKAAPEADIVKTALKLEKGTVETRGIEGVKRIYSFVPVEGTDKAIYVSLGITTNVAFAEVKQTLLRNAILLMIIALLTSAAAWFGGDYLIMQRIRKLIDATSELSKGNLSARVVFSGEQDEIGQLALSFNKMATALMHQLNFLQTLIDTIPSPVFYKDAEGKYLGCNSAFESLIGLLRADIIGKTVYEIAPRELAEIYYQADLSLLSNLGVQQYETSILSANGYLHDVILNEATFLDNNGKTAGIIGVILDITERKRSESALRDSEGRYRAVIEQSGDGIYLFDTETMNILEANQSFQKLLGYSSDDISHLNIYDIVAHDRADIDDKLKQIIERKQYALGERYYRRKDGTLLNVEVCVSHIGYKDRSVCLSVFRDITEIRKLEKEALKVQKLESIGVLAGGIAHDFNNLLQGIMGNIAIARSYAKEDKLQEILDKAERASMSAKELSFRLLTFSKGGQPVISVVYIDKLIRETANLLFEYTENVACEFVLPYNLYPVKGDEGQLYQVIRNISINAKEAMPDGGKVTFIGENVIVSKDDNLSLKPGDYVKISIKDEGAGIAGYHLTKIFDLYFTTKEMGSEKGTGLGLSICYSIIKKHEGLITVESRAGVGTTFHIYLPAYVNLSVA